MGKKLNNKGYLLPMTVIFTIIAVILGASILYLGGMEQIGAKRRLNREKAFYIAEAGAYRAYAHLKENSSWVPEDEPQSLGGGTFDVESDNTSSETIIITSTGTFNNVQEKVELTIKRSGGGIFSQGIFGGSQVYLSGSSQIWGYDSRTGTISEDADVGSNKKIEIAGDGAIHGNAYVPPNGSIIVPGWKPNAITGEKTKDAETRNLPPVTIPSALLALPYTQQGDPKISGNYKISGGNFTMDDWPRVAAMSSGDYHFRSLKLTKSDPQLTMTGNIRIYIEEDFSVTNNSNIIFDTSGSGTKVEIYIGTNGSVTFDNSGRINFDNSPVNLAIYVASSKEIKIIGNARVNGAIYAPNSKCTVQNSSELRGAIVADQVNLPGDAKIYYDVALKETSVPGDPGGGTGEITIIHWTKPDWKGRL